MAKQTSYEFSKSEVEMLRDMGWITPEPTQTPSGNWVLPAVRVITYDLGKRNFDRTFSQETNAMEAVQQAKSSVYNVYRIEKVNGEWRTDW